MSSQTARPSGRKIFGRKIFSVAVCAALALLAGAADAQQTGAQQVGAQDTTPRKARPNPGPLRVQLPDLSAYDCSTVSATPAAEVRHLGQWVKGKFHEWHEIYLTVGGTAKLACIAQVKPEAKQLQLADVKAFLTASAAIGAPNANVRMTPTEQPATAAELKALQSMQAEPLKRRGRTPSAASQTEQQKSTAPELPPVPAQKRMDPDQSSDAAPLENTVKRVRTAEIPADDATATPATVGIEDRVVVTSTMAYPWNTIGFLVISYTGGASFRCSGTLVSPYVVLTAGHCVHNNSRGGYVISARFYPGQSQASVTDNVQRPYGSKADVSALQTTDTWTQISGNDSYPVTDYKSDIAAIEFKTPFTFTDTFMPVLYSSAAGPVTSAGYPGLFQNTSAYGLYTDSGSDTSGNYLRSNHVRQFAIDASGGDSGSPFFYVDPATGQSSLVGSLSYGDDQNDAAGGPWYDSWNQSLLASWVSWTPSVAVAGSISGLRIGNIFSTAQMSSQSYLRFYNSGTTAGTVAVTLANPDTGDALANWTSPSIPAGSSLQFFIKEIEDNASQTFAKPPFYSLSIRPTFAGYMQHALWQVADNSLSNLTNCDTTTVTDAKVLMGVHSSLLAQGYPSTVVVYNTGVAAVNISLGIYDARNGNRIGTYSTGTLQPNAQKRTTVSAMETAASLSPQPGMYHYVVKADTNFTGYLQHVVNNTSDNVVTDLTGVCRLAP
jgi:V8-like Glu-specific endopeptidase